MSNEYGEIFEVYMDANKLDNKGRRIGFAVGFRDNGEDFRAYVQNSRMVGREWVDFGVKQRSKSFKSHEQARRWAYATAKERIAKLKEVK